MDDVGLGQPVSGETRDRPPRRGVLLAAAAEAPPPQPSDLPSEGGERLDVVRHGVIGEVAGHNLPQPGALLADRLMQAAAQGLLDLAQLGPRAVAPRLPVQRELAGPRRPADMREAEEGEGLGLAQAAPPPVRRRMAAELDEAGLL